MTIAFQTIDLETISHCSIILRVDNISDMKPNRNDQSLVNKAVKFEKEGIQRSSQSSYEILKSRNNCRKSTLTVEVNLFS